MNAEDLRQKLLTDPTDLHVHRSSAGHLLNQCRTVGARQEYLRAWMLGGEENEKKLDLAAVSLIEGNGPAVRKYLEDSAVAADSRHSEILAAGLSLEGGIEAAKRCLPAVPPAAEDVIAWLARALCCLSCGWITEARRACDAALRADSTFAPGRFLQGFLLRQAGRFREALPIYQRLAEELPANPSARFFLADSLVWAQRFQEASDAVRLAAQQCISHPGFRIVVARLLIAKRRYERADDLLTRSAFPPELQLDAAQYRVQCLVGLGRFDEAIDMATRQYPQLAEWPYVVKLLAQAERGRGSTESAEYYHRRYTELAPDEPEGWCDLALILLQQERWDDAEMTLNGVRNRFPEYRGRDYVEGVVALNRKNYGRAAACFDRFRRWRPDHSEAHYMFGVCHRYVSGGLVAQPAYDAWRKATQLNPCFTDAWYNVAYAGAIRMRELMERLAGSRPEITVSAKALPPLPLIEQAVQRGCPPEAFYPIEEYVEQTHRLWGLNCSSLAQRAGLRGVVGRLNALIRAGRSYGVPEQYLTGC